MTANPIASEPNVERVSRTEVVVAWPGFQVGCVFRRIRESDNGVIRGELSVESLRPDSPGHLGGPSLIEFLRSGAEVQRLSIELGARTGATVPWKDLLTGAIRRVLQEWRSPPEPVDWADMVPPDPRLSFLFPGFIPRNQTTALMADQRSGKSTLGMAIAVSTMTGIALPCGWRPELTGPVLYLDWETDEANVFGMLTEIQNGLRLRARPRGFKYLKMNGPLMHQIAAIQSLVNRFKPALTIIDSLGWAAGGNLNLTEVAIPTMDALASLETTRLALAHYAKGSRGNGTEISASVYGSGFFEFACRSIWELRKESTGGSSFNIGLYNRKLSRGLEGETMAIRLAFDPSRNAVEVLPSSIEQSPELAAKLPMHARIRALLRDEEASAEELAEALSVGREKPVTAGNVRAVISTMPDILRLVPNGTGRGHVQTYKVKAQDPSIYRELALSAAPSAAPESESARLESARQSKTLHFPGDGSRASNPELSANGTDDDHERLEF